MKNILIISTCALLCGCTQQNTGPRIEELMTERTALEARIVKLEADNLQLHADVELAQRHLKEIGIALSNAMPLVESIQSSMVQLMKLTNSPIPAVQKVSRAVNPPSVRGIPGPVYDQIAAAAAKKWGNDFNMQEYEVSNQVEAYLKLNPAGRAPGR